MSEYNSNIYAILKHAFIYNVVQNLIGGTKARKKMLSKYLQLKKGDSILDLGCGAGNMLELIKDKEVNYFGIDYNESYINFAKEKYGRQATFYCGDIADSNFSNKEFDYVFSIGVLHHLNDKECNLLITQAKNSLLPNGKFIAFEPIWTEDQSFASKIILKSDRGRNIKDKEGYLKLTSEHFNSTIINVDHNLFNVPYSISTIISQN